MIEVRGGWEFLTTITYRSRAVACFSLQSSFKHHSFGMSAYTAAHQNKSTPGPYTEAHLNQNGPGDARPTGVQIVDDNDLRGKLQDKVFSTFLLCLPSF